MNNCILIIGNDLYKLKILKTNLKNINEDIVIVTDTRIHDNLEEIKKLFDKVITVDEINNKFKQLVNNDFVNNYTMSTKVLAIWYMMKYYNYDNILHLDDDIIINNTNNLFDNRSKFFRFGFQAMSDRKASGKNLELLQNICSCFDLTFEGELWYHSYINAGEMIFNKKEFDLDLYEKALINYFTNECIIEKWNHRKKYTTGFLDERFMTAFTIKSNINNDLLNKDVSLIFANINKISDKRLINYLKKSIIHLACNSHKYKLYNRLIDMKLIEGEKYEER